MFLNRWTIPLKNLFVQCTSPSSKVSMISGGQVLGFHESSHTINSSGGHMETPLVNNFTNSTNSQVYCKLIIINYFKFFLSAMFGLIGTSFSFAIKSQIQKPRFYFFIGFINWETKLLNNNVSSCFKNLGKPCTANAVFTFNSFNTKYKFSIIIL